MDHKTSQTRGVLDAKGFFSGGRVSKGFFLCGNKGFFSKRDPLKVELSTLMSDINSQKVRNETLQPFMDALHVGIPHYSHLDRHVGQEEAKELVKQRQRDARNFVRRRAEAEVGVILGDLVPELASSLRPRDQLADTLCLAYDMRHAMPKAVALNKLLSDTSFTEILQPSVLKDTEVLQGLLRRADSFEAEHLDDSLKDYLILWNEVPAVRDMADDLLAELQRAVRVFGVGSWTGKGHGSHVLHKHGPDAKQVKDASCQSDSNHTPFVFPAYLHHTRRWRKDSSRKLCTMSRTWSS